MIAFALKYLFSRTSIALVLLVSTVSGIYIVLKPTEPELSVAQQRLIERLDMEVGEWLAQIEPTRRPAVLLTLHRDPFAHISDRIRDVVWRSDRFDLLDYSSMEKLRKRLDWTRSTPESRKDAVHIAERRKSDYVLWGAVEHFSDVTTPPELVVTLEVVEVVNSRLVASERFELWDNPRLFVGGNRLIQDSRPFFQLSLLTGLLVWVGFTLALPLLSYPLLKRVMRSDSNGAIIATLTGSVFTSVIVCYWVLARGAHPTLSAITLLLAFAIVLYYYYRTFEAIKRMNE